MAARSYYPRAAVSLVLLIEDWGAGTSATYTVTAIPRELEIHRNDHRTADTFRLQLDLRDFPFDPRTVRSARIEALIGDVGPPGSTLPKSGPDTAFIGFSDTIESSRSEAGDFVNIEGRDYTGPFLDTKWPGGMIDVSRALPDVIQDVIDAVPGADQIGVNPGVCYSEGASNVILADAIGRKMFAPHAGDDCWTVLCDLCGRVGLVPVFNLDALCILSAADFGVSRNAFVNDGAITPQTAAMEYGSNLTRLKQVRHAREAARKQIQVQCWDATTRKASTTTYPTSPILNKQTVGTDGKVKTEAAPIVPYYVTGTYSASDLATIAKNIYTEVSREEMETEIETLDMTDLDGVSIPQLGNGAHVTITIGAQLVTDISGLSPSEAIAALTSGPRALAADVATAFVAAFATAQKLSVTFYAKEVQHVWSRENGYRCQITAINFVGGAV